MLEFKNHESKYKDNKPVPAGFVYTGGSRNKYQHREYSPSLNPKECTNESDITEVIDPRFQSHSTTGWITDENGSRRKVKLLRDSGSLQSLFLCEKIRDCEYQDTGEVRLIRGIGGHVITVPLVEIILNSKSGSGKFLVGLIDTLHDSSFDRLVGNDRSAARS